MEISHFFLLLYLKWINQRCYIKQRFWRMIHPYCESSDSWIDNGAPVMKTIFKCEWAKLPHLQNNHRVSFRNSNSRLSLSLFLSRLWFQSAALRHEYVQMYKCGKKAWITAKSFPWINKNFKILTPHLLRSAGCESLCRTPGSCQSARAAERRTVMKTLVKAVTLWCECLLWFYWEKYIYKTLLSSVSLKSWVLV